MRQYQPSRRAVLERGLLLGVGGWAAAPTGCSSPDNAPAAPTPTTPATPTPTRGGATAANRILLAYFSRPGENYYYGGRRNLEVGNTEVLARIIAELIDCDVHRIEATDAYPASYDATVARNVREQNADDRPAIADPLASIEQYDAVLLGSPIWNVRPPMIMTTFTESYDFTGMTVHPRRHLRRQRSRQHRTCLLRLLPRSADRPRPGGAGRRRDPAPHRRRD